jgi:hypothetical protein
MQRVPLKRGPANAAAEILPYELITAGEALSLLPAEYIAALFAHMPPPAAAAVGLYSCCIQCWPIA